jgi:FAD/FMN-containing dehydrogenase/Fe-S oxidoreductase
MARPNLAYSALTTESIAKFTEQIEGEVYSDPLTLGIYGTDASMYQINPLLVVIPKDRSDVLRAIRLCRTLGLPLLARGAGTSLTGQSVGSGVILDLSKHINQILELNLEEGWVRVEPGLVCSNLNAYLKPYGVHFAPDPATLNRASIGGMVANNAAGMRSVRYGMTIEHVEALDLALASGDVLNFGPLSPEQLKSKEKLADREGEIYRGLHKLIERYADEIQARYPKVMRRSGGYALDALLQPISWNIAKLLCGSEGTLGVILEVKLKLTPLPKHTAVCLAHFDNLNDALNAAKPLVDAGASAVEVIDGSIINQAKQHPLTNSICRQVKGNPAAILIIEVQGESLNEAHIRIKKVEHLLLERAYAVSVMFESKAIQSVWQLRSSSLGLMTTIPGRKKPVPYIEDAAIPLDQLSNYVTDVLSVCQRYDQPVSMFGHASVGVIHIRPLHDLHQADEVERMIAIQEAVFPLVQKYGGAWSGEHGDGIVRGGFNRRFFGDELYEAFQEVKQLFDPELRINPGKIIETPTVAENRRYGSRYSPLIVDSKFNYRQSGGMLAAAELCTGVGACRKTQSGVMCPSYQATREEAHSTRGRANALRLALSGQLGSNALSNHNIRDILDLCLACKGCKGECPNGVDMARLKAEVLEQHHRKHGTPIRSHFFGNLSLFSHWSVGPQAKLINLLLRNSWLRGLLNNLLGIDSKRSLPIFATQRLSKWFQKRGGSRGDGKVVVLFNDTYMEYYLPQVGQATIEVLEAAGYRVELATLGDSQRSAISQGLLDDAKEHGTRLFQKLDKLLNNETPLLVCEPSCATALIDDLPDLIDDVHLGERISSRVQMVDSFLEKELIQGECQLAWRKVDPAPCFLVHTHCHQKSLDGGIGTLNLLSQIPGSEVIDTEAGCCGMAGSFGYESEHVALSTKIANQRLIPAIMQTSKETYIVSNGFSCRHQIADLTPRKSLHVMELVKLFLNNQEIDSI